MFDVGWMCLVFSSPLRRRRKCGGVSAPSRTPASSLPRTGWPGSRWHWPVPDPQTLRGGDVYCTRHGEPRWCVRLVALLCSPFRWRVLHPPRPFPYRTPGRAWTRGGADRSSPFARRKPITTAVIVVPPGWSNWSPLLPCLRPAISYTSHAGVFWLVRTGRRSSIAWPRPSASGTGSCASRRVVSITGVTASVCRGACRLDGEPEFGRH